MYEKIEFIMMQTIISGTKKYEKEDITLKESLIITRERREMIANKMVVFKLGKYVLNSAIIPENMALERIKKVKNINAFR